jgi:hypothetical protein
VEPLDDKTARRLGLVDWDDETFDAYVAEMDGEQFVFYKDPSDGYRSYCNTMIPKAVIPLKNRFEPQLLYRYEMDDGSTTGFVLKNASGAEVLKVVTEDYDDYYPVGVLEYTPGNLPCNRDLTVNA